MSEQTSTEEKLSVSLPKKYSFIIEDSNVKVTRPGKEATIQTVLKIGCNLDSVRALSAIREFQKTGKAVVGVYSRQVAVTMKNRVDEILSHPSHAVFGILTKIEPV